MNILGDKIYFTNKLIVFKKVKQIFDNDLLIFNIFISSIQSDSWQESKIYFAK